MVVIPFIENAGLFFEDTAKGYNGRIACLNWPREFPYTPEVKFAVAHTGKEICLKYQVRERRTRAMVTEDNGCVWTDSCVEFFLSFDEKGYYNFEFTCIGKALLGFRKERENPVHAEMPTMRSIVRRPSLGEENFEEVEGDNRWELEVVIPASALFNHNIKSLAGVKARANFYKCGDGLSVPHFLSWQPIDNHKPDFHLEEFFGDIVFEG